MSLTIFSGILLPFIGTTLGGAAVFFTPKSKVLHNIALSGFASGIMVAASVWSLIIPAVEMSSHLGYFAFFPMLSGLWAGIVFLLLSEKVLLSTQKEDAVKDTLFFMAVILHNIPEGMAVGVAFAAAISQNSPALLLSALLLSFGMTMQNIPEGAIISLPLASKGFSRHKAFVYGSLSGVAEPFFAVITFAFSAVSTVLLPYLLGFAAGAMIYVCVKELIPEAKGTKGCLYFMLGFSVMMILDIALG